MCSYEFKSKLNKNTIFYLDMANRLVGSEGCSFSKIVTTLVTHPSAGQLSDGWRDIARMLHTPFELKDRLRRQILVETKNYKDALDAILEEWRLRESNNASLNALINIMEACYYNDMADKIRRDILVPLATCWSDLDIKTKARLTQKPIYFLDKKLTIDKLAEIIGSDEINNILNETFDAKIIGNLVSKSDVCLASSMVPDLPKCYIPRSLTISKMLDPQIFEEPGTKDIFIFEKGSIKRNKLIQISRGKGTDRSSLQLKSITARFIILEMGDHFQEICKISQNPVHLIKHINGEYIWVKTKGNLKLIKKFVRKNPGQQQIIPDSQFIQNLIQNSYPVCISAEPGMGKTVILAKIATTIQIYKPEVITLFTTFRKLISEVQSKNFTVFSQQKLCQILASSTTTSYFGKKVVTKLLIETPSNVHLFLDGYDEIFSNQRPLARTLIRQIRTNIIGIKLYVTTRPHFCQELEESLGVLAYNILQLEESQQIDLLVKHFELELKVTETETPTKLRKFAQEILCNLDFSTNSPLYCKMLAQIYQNDLQIIMDGDPNDKIVLTMVVSSAYDLHKKWIDIKFKKFELDQLKVIDDKQYLMSRLAKMVKIKGKSDLINELFMGHVSMAIQETFPEFGSKFEVLIGQRSKSRSKLYKIGLVECRNGQTHFIHRTIAEYFVSEFLVWFLKKNRKWTKELLKPNFLELLLNHVLIYNENINISRDQDKKLFDEMKITLTKIEFQNPLISYFFNESLGIHRQLIDPKYIYIFFDKSLKNIESSNIIDHSICCARSGLTNLLKLFHGFSKIPSKSIKSVNAASPIKIVDLLCSAAVYLNRRDFELCCKILEETTKKPREQFILEINTVLLNISSSLGRYSLVEHLIDSNCKEKISEVFIKNLVQFIVRNSATDDINLVQRKSEIIKLLLKRSNLNIKDWVIDVEKVHGQLTNCLLEQGLQLENFEDDRIQNRIFRLC